jgi:hypothetical protein
MDATLFDRLTRGLMAAPSRRRVLCGLGALAVPGLADARKKRKKHKKKCKGGKKKCGKKCIPQANCCLPGDCAADELCSGGVCVALDCGAGGPCRVFVTSTTSTGSLGGLAGADAKCQTRAVAAGLPGTYMAWLSDASVHPASRFTQSTGPYQLVTGATVATSWSDLTDGTLAAAINVNELGTTVGAPYEVWTNTKPDGTPVTDNYVAHCDSWTDATAPPPQGRYGLTQATTNAFTAAAIGDCNSARRLYCFQQS